MVFAQASKLTLLPKSSSSSSLSLSCPQFTSLLFDPDSLSLALMHSDSSFSLYPSFSPLSLSSLPSLQTLVPTPSSSATFLTLRSSVPGSPSRHVFLVSSPFLGGSAVFLRFYILRKSSQSFAKSRVICNQRELSYDNRRSGVVFGVNHGVSMKLSGSTNVFAMYSVSNSKIWVFAVKIAGNEDDETTVKLMKSATIECSVPVFSITASFGFLMMGEENGVRVFPLRPLMKGQVKKPTNLNKSLNGELKNMKLEGEKMKLPNGVTGSVIKTDNFHGIKQVVAEVSSNGHLEEKLLKKQHNFVKLRPLKLSQHSKEFGAFHVALKTEDVGDLNLTKMPLKSAKAISIQALSRNKYLILDSVGDLHLLCLFNHVNGPGINFHVKELTRTMKVQKMAVLPEISAKTHKIWISDGNHSIHMITASDEDASNDSEENLTRISVMEAIFTSEKIQEITPLASNGILALGQASLFAYAIA